MRYIKKVLLLVLLLPLSTLLSAQEYTTMDSAGKKVLKYYDNAQTLSRAEQFPEALEQLDKALKIDPQFIDGKILRASLNGASGQLEKAAAEFEEVLKMAPDYLPRVWYELAITEMDLRLYDRAATHFEQYLERDPKSNVRKQKAEHHLINARFAANAITHPVPFEPVNLGTAINTEGQEYLPSLTADGTRLVFTARVGNQEDFYYSVKKDQIWQPRQPMEKINTPQNEGAQCISADGRLLVFTRCDSRAGMGGCDLYFSSFQGGQWTDPKKIEGAINTSAWEGQPSLSADGQNLYFASDRSGGLGQRDLWMSRLKENGQWGTPTNLGPEINTPYNDQCPFIHPDNRTLYFCSEGHPGMGGIDLYFSKKDSLNQWTPPLNIGYPINTPANEGTLVVSIDGQTAYYASDKDSDETTPASVLVEKPSSRLNIDIFSFSLYEEARPDPVTYVKAKVVDSRSHRGFEANAEIIDLATGKTVTKTVADDLGELLLCLPAGKDYALYISKEKYLFYSENFSLHTPASIEAPYQIYVELQPVTEASIAEETAPEKPVVLKNVFFETGSAELKNASASELDKLFDLLTDNPELNIQINGHTDNVGNEADNLLLSEKRAKAVYGYLIEKGIDSVRLRYKGFGETKPVADNESEAGRKVNRRTEFVVW
ncbi:MAG: PD40 domain-containing protein [Saprospiraceae bacterium]|nr:PD40 domain-containing protein [Saprospiraceae bacterium]MCB9326904.1 PD40 domain-containing protein [Lewinellaceae bacterium]